MPRREGAARERMARHGARAAWKQGLQRLMASRQEPQQLLHGMDHAEAVFGLSRSANRTEAGAPIGSPNLRLRVASGSEAYWEGALRPAVSRASRSRARRGTQGLEPIRQALRLAQGLELGESAGDRPGKSRVAPRRSRVSPWVGPRRQPIRGFALHSQRPPCGNAHSPAPQARDPFRQRRRPSPH